jgi:hypothetical protein
MKEIKVKFTDFWGPFNKNNNFFTWVFEQAGYKLILSENPDLVIFSCFGYEHKNYNCKKLYYTAENDNYREAADFSMTFDTFETETRIRVPYYTYMRWAWSQTSEDGDGPVYNNGMKHNIGFDTIFNPKVLSKEELFSIKTNFCAFIQGNPKCEYRNNFFHLLNSKKRVDSSGLIFNNTGTIISWDKKLDYLKHFKFAISFENQSSNGYITEKIFEPMLVQTIPIYWGSNTVSYEFNNKAIINVNELSVEDTVDLVLKLDSDDDMYYEMYRQPFLPNNELTEWIDFNKVIDFVKYKVLA